MRKPIVAVVGRPNVGKSSFFNKIVGQRVSIVDDTPGVTRDRIYSECEWLNNKFILIDTGGIEPKSDDVILSQMKVQAELAIDMADVILFMVSIHEGLTSNDEAIAIMLRKSKKPILLVVNKVDQTGNVPPELYEFYNFGLGEPFPVSSLHGHGTGDLLDEVVSHFPKQDDEYEDDDTIKVAVIGKPNVGKSSLINKILGENRVIVSDIAGTTRDAIDVEFEFNSQKYSFIDTAGLRKRKKIEEDIERYSTIRSLAAVDRSDVCLIMIDATEGVTEQDTKIAGYAHNQGKASIIVVNKWDLVEKDTKTMDNHRKDIAEKLSYMSYAPSIFISAKTGQRIDRLFELIKFVNEQSQTRISTGVLNDIINEAIALNQPPSDKGKPLKIFYGTQGSIKPPTFILFINNKEIFHFSYQRYIENQIRKAFGFEGTPIKIFLREKGDKYDNF